MIRKARIVVVVLCLAAGISGCSPAGVQFLQPLATLVPTVVLPAQTGQPAAASQPGPLEAPPATALPASDSAASSQAPTQDPQVQIVPALVTQMPVNPTLMAPAGLDEPAPPGEPAGCLAAGTQVILADVDQMLSYADVLLNLPRSLASRQLEKTWNVFTHSTLPLKDGPVLALDVSDVQNEYLLQRMLDSLHVAGFVTWLRAGPEQDLHILAVALRDPAIMQSDWAGYVRAYWQERDSLPPGDPFVIAALKLPPCAWMVSAGFAPPVSDWWRMAEAQPPDLASAGAAFLADNSDAANQVARQLDWLGWDGIEAANNMCGPLAWAILRGAGVLPADVGGWSRGPETFWLANPRTNGRPWSLFPRERYSLTHFSQALGEFDFSTFPLYPGDVLYTYSREDGFDHMLVVTELDESGGRYTVTNLVKVYPQNQVTIEHALLYNPNDPSVGLFKNEWRRDRRNGRTGHDGFDVFRWAWLEKDLNQQAVAYTIQPGDSFGRLALEWRTPPGWIARYNQMQVGDMLIVGQQLQIPPNKK